MESAVVKRSIKLNGHKTSVSLENVFWTELKQIAHFQNVTMSSLVSAIAATRQQGNLSSAIRVFVVEHLQGKYKPAGPPQSARATVGSNESRSLRLGEALQGVADGVRSS